MSSCLNSSIQFNTETFFISFKSDESKIPSKETHAIGITERGAICSFEFTLGASFYPGAGIAPTHGGFLMCGKNADFNNVEDYNYFSVSRLYEKAIKFIR